MVTTLAFLQYYLKSSTKRGWEMSSLLVAIQFERLTGAKTELSFDKPLPDPDSNLVVVDGIVDINSMSFTQHIDYSIAHNYIDTNPNAAFYG